MTDELVPVERSTIVAALRGTSFATETSDALVLHRLPEWTRVQAADENIHRVADHPVGVHLAFATSAETIGLDLRVRREAAFPHPVIVATACGGAEVDRAVIEGEVVHLRLRTGATAAGSRVEVWMPQNAGVDILAVWASAAVRPAEHDDRPRWIHHGSSISHGLEADGPLGTWPTIASRALDWNLTNLGFSGQAMLDPFVARTIRDLPADIITLKLGINIVGAAAMRTRTFVPAVHGFLDTIRDGHPGTPIVLVSPIHSDRYGTAFSAADPGALDLGVVRDLLEQIADRRGDPRLYALNGLELLAAADSDRLHDGLHPDAAGYRLMGERFLAIARRSPWGCVGD